MNQRFIDFSGFMPWILHLDEEAVLKLNEKDKPRERHTENVSESK